MSPRLSRIVLVGTLSLLPAVNLAAQNSASNARAQATAQAPASNGATVALTTVRAALEAAERGQFNAAQYPGLVTHPLYGWIELASLRRDVDNVSTAQAQAFLKRYDGQAVADNFRSLWLASLSLPV